MEEQKITQTVERLREIFDAPVSATPQLTQKLDRVSQLDVPVASELGELLCVLTRREREDSYVARWTYQIIGRRSSEKYFELVVSLENPDGELRPDPELADFMGVAIQIALHHPADVSDELWRSYHQLAGEAEDRYWKCKRGDASFITYKEAVEHERAAHGISDPDQRPRIGELDLLKL